ncbi:helix-turn-helix domain-containing protein [Bacillus sp. ISL-39]|uniref:helix-turn-helix domain-containing protein n=1 Tax=Bacillus sp. ISL-39 TaxID=2819124 RepID=UPI001BEBA2E3|nr:helix-turn-helix domain-containing protein [Bacillus sp. ISL-39]
MPEKGQIYKNYEMEVKIKAIELKKNGRSYSQIANELNIKNSTVKTWWSRYLQNGNTFFLDKRGQKIHLQIRIYISGSWNWRMPS